MNKLFTLLFCFAFCSVHGQTITFDPGDTLYPKLIVIDTINYHHNIWQISKPDKTVFTSAHSAPNAIVTDTVNPYPINDTSVFILKLPAWAYIYQWGWGYAPLWIIHPYYQLNIDSNAIARIEISEDSGMHWFNIIDSLPNNNNHFYNWGSDIPDLSASTNGWTSFTLYRQAFSNMNYSDTVLFRFTFISDSIQANKDGWMIDDILFEYYVEGVPQIQNDDIFSVYPNPSQGEMYIHANEQNPGQASITVCDMAGWQVYKSDNIPANDYLNLPLPNGVYILKYSTDKEFAAKRIIIER